MTHNSSMLDGLTLLGQENEGKLVRIDLQLSKEWKANLPSLQQWLTYYRKKGELPLLNLDWEIVTPFQQEVYKYLLKIPFGEVVTYGEVARDLDSSPRAVGRACGANPWIFVVPCHRVVAATKNGGGYGPGLPVKEKLLAFERL